MSNIVNAYGRNFPHPCKQKCGKNAAPDKGYCSRECIRKAQRQKYADAKKNEVRSAAHQQASEELGRFFAGVSMDLYESSLGRVSPEAMLIISVPDVGKANQVISHVCCEGCGNRMFAEPPVTMSRQIDGVWQTVTFTPLRCSLPGSQDVKGKSFKRRLEMRQENHCGVMVRYNEQIVGVAA